MKTKDKKLLIFIISVLSLTFAACALRTAALLLNLNFTSGYFLEHGLITAASVIIAAAVLTAISYLFLGKANSSLVPDFHGAATFIPSGLLALSVIFTIGDFFSRSAPFKESAGGVILIIVAIVCAVASVIYLFLTAFLGRRYSLIRGAFAFAPMIFILAYASRIYFDTSLPINAPNKSVDLFAFVAAMLFFTAEARLSLGREKWRLYTTLGLACAALCAYSSIPALIAAFVKSSGHMLPTVSLSTTQSVFALALCIFAVARISLTLFLKTDEPGAIASSIAAKEISESEEDATEDENQISIDDILNVQEIESESDK